MNWPQLHLALVHFPVVGAMFSLVLFGLALRFRSDLVFRIACGFTVFCAIVAAVSYYAGEQPLTWHGASLRRRARSRGGRPVANRQDRCFSCLPPKRA